MLMSTSEATVSIYSTTATICTMIFIKNKFNKNMFFVQKQFETVFDRL